MSLDGGLVESGSQSRTSSPCPSCGENSLEFSNHNSEEQSVCTGCGVVQTTFTNLVNQTPFISMGQGSGGHCFNNFNKKEGPRFPVDPDKVILGHCKIEFSKQLHCLLVQLQASKAVEERAVHVLTKANLLGQCFTEDQIVGACAYIAFRNNEVPITLKTILCHLSPECSIGSLGKAVKKILNLTNLKILPTINLSQSVEWTLSPGVFWDSLGNVQEMFKITEDSTKLLKLLQELDSFNMLISPEVIIAAAYLAYVNRDLNRRKKLTWTKFLQECELNSSITVSSKRSRNIVSALLNQLKMMAYKLPWIGQRKFKNDSRNLDVLYYYNDILEIKETIKDKLRDCKSNKKRKVIHSTFVETLKDIKVPREILDQEIDEEITSYLRTPQEIEMVKKIKRENF